jgi:multiple sugar transport system permease protein/raffinose/stachyose/melibiose transport system permease protein
MTATVESMGARPNGRNRGRRGVSRLRQSQIYPSWLLWPAFLFLFVFFFLPNALNFVYAFTDWSAFKNTINGVGFDQFTRLLQDNLLVSDIRSTIIFAALVAVFQNVFGLGLALLLEKDTRINRTARAFFFLPVLMSALAVGYMFQALLRPDGALNQALSFISGQSISIPWLGNTTWTIVVVALVNAWKWTGLSMLIYLAGLKTMPEDILEAARIDGASWWKTLWQVRFPLLAPAVTFNVATGLLGSLNSFDVVQATTQGGPGRSTEVLNIFIYHTFGSGLFAQATAMSLILLILVAALAFPVIGILRRRENVL